MFEISDELIVQLFQSDVGEFVFGFQKAKKILFGPIIVLHRSRAEYPFLCFVVILDKFKKGIVLLVLP